MFCILTFGKICIFVLISAFLGVAGLCPSIPAPSPVDLTEAGHGVLDTAVRDDLAALADGTQLVLATAPVDPDEHSVPRHGRDGGDRAAPSSSPIT